jgi:cytoskeletal protein CcmA (bactofilin family)
MFSKTSDPTSSPQTPSAAQRPGGSANSARSILGNDLKITGEITSTGAIEVYGEIDGNLTADTLTVGQEGRISGSVKAHTVEVKGHVDGKIDSGSFTMRATSQVAADVSYASLVIESGAQIEGRFSKSG